MKKIFKYDLHYYSTPEIVRLPKSAIVVDFAIQDKSFKIWALVDPENSPEERVFCLVMTGQEIPWKVNKIFGTKIIQETGIVVHLLELDKETKASDSLKDDRLNKSSDKN